MGKFVKNARKPKAKRPPKLKPVKNKLFDDREEVINELDDKAENYYDAVQRRLPLTKAEDEAKTSLIEAMVKYGKHRYKTADDKIVELTDKHSVKVKEPKEPSENGSE